MIEVPAWPPWWPKAEVLEVRYTSGFLLGSGPGAGRDHLAVAPAPGWERRADNLTAGTYRGDWRSFSPGSHWRYNWFREWLCGWALGVPLERVWRQPEYFAGEPFIELLDFCDDRGVIGPRTSAKLASDFEARRPLPKVWLELQDLYVKFQHAFSTAAHGGMVVFVTGDG